MPFYEYLDVLRDLDEEKEESKKLLIEFEAYIKRLLKRNEKLLKKNKKMENAILNLMGELKTILELRLGRATIDYII